MRHLAFTYLLITVLTSTEGGADALKRNLILGGSTAARFIGSSGADHLNGGAGDDALNDTSLNQRGSRLARALGAA